MERWVDQPLVPWPESRDRAVADMVTEIIEACENYHEPRGWMTDLLTSVLSAAYERGREDGPAK